MRLGDLAGCVEVVMSILKVSNAKFCTAKFGKQVLFRTDLEPIHTTCGRGETFLCTASSKPKGKEGASPVNDTRGHIKKCRTDSESMHTLAGERGERFSLTFG